MRERLLSVPLLPLLEGWAGRRWYVVLAPVLVLYGVGFTTNWRINPDSSHLLLMARSIAEQGELAHPRGLHQTVPVGFPYLLATTFKGTGGEHIWAANAVILACGLATLGLTFWLFALHANRGTAVVVTALVGIAETFYRQCYEIVPDIAFALGLLLALVGLERFYRRRRRVVLSLALLLGGIIVMGLMRNVVVVAVGAIGLALVWEAVRRRKFLLLGSALVVCGAGLLLVRSLDPGTTGAGALNPDERLMVSLLTEKLPETLHRAVTLNLYDLLCVDASRAAFGMDFGPLPHFLLSLVVLGAGLATWRARPAWGLLVAAFIVQWLLFIVSRRYFVPVMPLLAFGIWSMALGADRRFRGRWPAILAGAFLVLWLGTNAVRVGRFIAEQQATPFLDEYAGGRYASLDAMAAIVRAETPEDSVLVVPSKFVPALMFWTRREAYARVGRPVRTAAGTRAVYAILPLPTEVLERIEKRGWSLGPALGECARPGDQPSLVLRPVLMNQ